MDFKVHRKQFYLTNQPNFKIKDFETKELNANLFLHFDSELDIQQFDDCCYFLGKYLKVADKRLEQFICKIDNDLIRSTYNCLGKWAYIKNNYIISDAAGIMGVYYSQIKKNKGESWFAISSSVALIKKYFWNDKISPVNKKIIWRNHSGDAMNWYCAPGTRYQEIRKLLPSQKLLLKDCSLEYTNRYFPQVFSSISYTEKTELLATYYKEILRIIKENYSNIGIALTAGNDSRLLLATALNQSLSFFCYTFNFPGINPQEVVIPKKLSKRYKFIHKLIKEETTRRTPELYDQHTAGMTNDGDRYFYINKQFDQLNLKKGDVILRSVCSEIARLVYRDIYTKKNMLWEDVDLQPFLKYYNANNDEEEIIKPLNEFVAWHKTNNKSNIDWRDIWFFEQKMNGWLSSVEQSLDILPFDAIDVTNSQAMFDIYLSFNYEQRNAPHYKHGKIQPNIIKQLRPDILNIPINPPLTIIQRVERKLYSSINKLFLR